MEALDSSREAEIWIHSAHYLTADQKQVGHSACLHSCKAFYPSMTASTAQRTKQQESQSKHCVLALSSEVCNHLLLCIGFATHRIVHDNVNTEHFLALFLRLQRAYAGKTRVHACHVNLSMLYILQMLHVSL